MSAEHNRKKNEIEAQLKPLKKEIRESRLLIEASLRKEAKHVAGGCPGRGPNTRAGAYARTETACEPDVVDCKREQPKGPRRVGGRPRQDSTDRVEDSGPREAASRSIAGRRRYSRWGLSIHAGRTRRRAGTRDNRQSNPGRLLGILCPRTRQAVCAPPLFFPKADPSGNKIEVRPGFLSVLARADVPTTLPPADGRPTSGRRRALAEWIASPENPLTARVMVNRIWQHHFGRGIVSTPSNFGKMGALPTHPELLDWLAIEFVEKGWSVKKMHRLIMTSQAYQMASEFQHAGNLKTDAENNWLWRFPVRRLEGEIIRDIILSASGQLNPKAGGPPFFPALAAAVAKT